MNWLKINFSSPESNVLVLIGLGYKDNPKFIKKHELGGGGKFSCKP